MKIGNIVPPSALRLLDAAEDYHLILAEVVARSDEYALFYSNRRLAGDFVILDNGAYEYGKTPDLDLLIAMAQYVWPSEVVLPDDMHGPNCHLETVRMSGEAVPKLRAAGLEHLMAVPHGHTIEEWVWCADALLQLACVDCLGIAEKDALKLAHGDRAVLMRELVWLGAPAIHFLGMMEDMADVKSEVVREAVRGVDGSKLVVWGATGRVACPTARTMPHYPGRPKEYFELPWAYFEPHEDCILANIDSWREFIREGEGVPA
jgi:hypothetical protein